MKWFWQKKNESFCEFQDSCDCNAKKVKTISCESCRYYWFIDSGYGYCKALPQPSIVAWCKDICSLFKEKNR